MSAVSTAARCAQACLLVMGLATAAFPTAAGLTAGCRGCPDEPVAAGQICECDEQCPEGLSCWPGGYGNEVHICTMWCDTDDECRAAGFGLSGICITGVNSAKTCCIQNSSAEGVHCVKGW